MSAVTALDQHRDRNSSAALLGPVREQIAAGVEFLYYQSVTLTGRVIGKVVPACHLERNAIRGVQLHRSAMTDLQVTRGGELLGGGTQAGEFTAVPDLDTFAVLPWDTRVARFFCRLYEPDDRAEHAGEPLATDARGNLARVHAAFTQRTGLELRSGCEPEMTWSGPGLGAACRPGSSPAYHVDHLERYRPIYQKVIGYARSLGLNMIEGDYEDPGQLELNWMFDHADLTADRLITYRQICRQVARELGVTASFMPKPAAGQMGNGCHHNLSLWRDGVNILLIPGVARLHLSDPGRDALGGILAHSPAAMAVMGPTVNSYKRYWDAGQFAPSRVDWGLDDKTCTVRLPASGRLEYKLPDAMVNPYLSHAILIAAIEDGLAGRIDPGPPGAGDGNGFDRLPLSLGEALECFRADPVIKTALGAELMDVYDQIKTDEWARFCGAVTDWEHMMYATELP